MRISPTHLALPLVLGLGLIPSLAGAENVRAEWLLAVNQARQTEDQSRAFDFLMGRWEIHNRRLVKRLQGSNEWQEFEAHSVCDALPGRLGNQDEYRTDFWQGFVGLSLRFFDPKSRPVVDLLDRQSRQRAAAAGDRRIRGRRRRFRRIGSVPGPADPGALYVVACHDASPALGTGVFSGWRQDLGNQLDHGFHTRQGDRCEFAIDGPGGSPVAFLRARAGHDLAARTRHGVHSRQCAHRRAKVGAHCRRRHHDRRGLSRRDGRNGPRGTAQAFSIRVQCRAAARSPVRSLDRHFVCCAVVHRSARPLNLHRARRPPRSDRECSRAC